MHLNNNKKKVIENCINWKLILLLKYRILDKCKKKREGVHGPLQRNAFLDAKKNLISNCLVLEARDYS